MKASTQPTHCKGCPLWHRAGHPKGSKYATIRENNWCCKYGTTAQKAVSICLQQNGKPEPKG